MHLLTSCDSKPMEACFLRVKNDKVLAIFYLFCTIVNLYVAILNVYLIIASLYLTMWLNFAVSDFFSNFATSLIWIMLKFVAMQRLNISLHQSLLWIRKCLIFKSVCVQTNGLCHIKAVACNPVRQASLLCLRLLIFPIFPNWIILFVKIVSRKLANFNCLITLYNVQIFEMRNIR